MQKLLVSIRGKNEAIEAVKGGAQIADVEYPVSALGTPYPLNICSVRKIIPKRILVSTNIGEEQAHRSTAAQAALGVATAGADIVKVGFASMQYKEASYLASNVVRSVKHWYPKKKVIPTFFADSELVSIFNPIVEGPKLAPKVNANGVLIDTFDKMKGKRLVDYFTYNEIKKFVKKCHPVGVEAWIAGSIKLDELRPFCETGVDVICVRGAACGSTDDRLGRIQINLVRKLVQTMKD